MQPPIPDIVVCCAAVRAGPEPPSPSSCSVGYTSGLCINVVTIVADLCLIIHVVVDRMDSGVYNTFIFTFIH